MKQLIPFLLTLTLMTTNTSAQSGKAKTTKTTFNRETTVSTIINADPAIIWALRTKASDYPRWNSTVISIEGNIALNEKIKLRSALDAKTHFQIEGEGICSRKKIGLGRWARANASIISRKMETRP